MGIGEKFTAGNSSFGLMLFGILCDCEGSHLKEIMAEIKIQINADLDNRLTLMSAKLGYTKKFFIKKLINDGIEDIEDEMLLDIMYKEMMEEAGLTDAPGTPREKLDLYLARERASGKTLTIDEAFSHLKEGKSD